jgi:hypothetical protein
MRKSLLGLFLALGVSAFFIPGVQAQLTGASTGIRTVVSDLIEWTGTQKFRDDVVVGGSLTVTGAQTNSATVTGDDLVAVDDLTVGDDAAITGDLAVTGTVTSIGGVTSPLTLSAAKVRFYHGTKTLTEAGGAEAVFTLTTATTESTGGTLYYRIRATDATDYVARVGSVFFVCNNLAGTVTSAVSVADQTGSVVETTNAKTLTYAITDSNAANTCVINFNIDSDMTVTAASMEWFLLLTGPGTLS